MTLKQFLKARAKLEAQAERQFEVRLKRALQKTVEPVYEAARLGMLQGEDQVKTLLKKTFIEEEFRWLYVVWGYRMLRWFQINSKQLQQKDDFWLQKLEDLFRVKAGEKITAVYTTTLDKTVAAVRAALKLANIGASIDKIQDAIREEIEGANGAISQARARMIARTEVISASNQASFTAVGGENVKTEKKWLTGGANIRDTHLAAKDQGWIPYEEPFRVGAYDMMHPGDPAGGPEEVINCKCTLIYRVVD